MADLRYPIGQFDLTTELNDERRLAWINDIAQAPARLRSAVDGLGPDELATPYRPGGWSVRQVVHHLPDSHLNAYTRVKLALTEDTPTIKPYFEERWAELEDARNAPVEVSLSLLEALHRRWVLLLSSLTPADWGKKFRHPDLGVLNLGQSLGLYAWHGRHHVAQITRLRERMGWNVK
jgi:uncharacterized damage-inducible protein DinB